MGALTLVITGAGGFLGRATVARARARGHAVRAVLRQPAPHGWARDAGIMAIRADLAEALPDDLFDGACAVIHAAARMTGDDLAQTRDTVAPTEAVLEAAARAGARLVLVGSLSVIGAAALAPFDTVDEGTLVEARPELRDPYTRAKLRQEQLAREIATRHGAALRIVRPGALFGPGQLWNAHLGVTLGPLLIGPRHHGELPLCWLPHAAAALVLAAEAPAGAGFEVIHAVDDDRPDRSRFLRAIGQRAALPLGWRGVDAVAGALAPFGARLPGLLRRPVLRARWMPLRYSNARLRALGWRPEADFDAAMAAARAGT